MGFSGIGIWEIVLILVIIVVVLGPQRLPEIARSLGRAFRAIKKASSDISLNISKELEESQTTKPSPPTDAAPHATPAPSALTREPPKAKQPRPPAKDKPAAPPEEPQPKDE